MKALKFLFAGFLLMTLSTQAQVSVNVNINTPPVWGPVGYAETRYYYIPDIEVYYDVPSAMFIYFDGGGWIRAAYLPYRYRHYDLYGAYKVCLHDYGPNPYVYYKHHKVKYHHGYRGPYQRTIGARPQVVYNGPREGYRHERNDDDRKEYYRNDYHRNDYHRNTNDNRGERKHNDYRTEYKNSGSGYTKNDNGHGRGRGNDGNGNGNGRGNGNGGGRGHGQRG
ncbi:hypothetical protein FLJC2902T_26590 [Flavobacterium limnosediminis JC2902]|uniref:Uncharacterized protein n=1 Tax=Flavobacterium limnosediminis JC2902 TaxID=1341181 RepID=V6SJT9_9FLAO|nr:hypothetical protein [Flavobacterium limnosediminis]ESU26684.1 hypothetical protein FLJC2902T_26590 [Flavobacterium limnosediminis JC2902]